MKALNASQAVSNARLQFELVEHFASYTDTQLWTKTDADVGASVAIDADGVGGLMLLTTGATDNNEAYLETTNELFDVLADRPINFAAAISYTEANTDDANVLVGLMDAPGADSLVDDGAGPKSSYSGIVFFKVDGGTVWNFETSVAGTQTTTATDVTAGGAQLLEFDVIPISSTVAECIPKIDGQQCRDANGDLIRHSLTYTSVTEMAVVVGVKAGGANSEVLTLKMVAATQKY